MGKKIFVTYKYGDKDVLSLRAGEFSEMYNPTTVRDYVDKLQNNLDKEDHINKGEDDGEDLSDFKDSTIASKLRDKIYDSSITIILISPNMKEFWSIESNQWIPWEISYSLKEHTRNGRTSQTNALLAIVLPDRSGSYEYYLVSKRCNNCNCTVHKTDKLFKIHRDNLFNAKKPQRKDCSYDDAVYLGASSYIHTVKWVDFIGAPNLHIGIAEILNDNINDYNVTKTVN